MRRRFEYLKHAPGGYRAVTGLERYLERCGLGLSRGCAYCMDMPWRELRTHRFLTSF
jgi:hypothetical protein